MRVVFVVPYFYPAMGYGGTPRLAYEIARALARRGHDITVLTTDSAGDRRISRSLAANLQATGLDGIRVRYCDNLSNYLAYRHRVFLPTQFIQNARRYFLDSDVVHIHDLRSFLAVASHSISRSRDIPYVLSPHGGLRHLGKKSAKMLFDFLWGKAILRDAAALCAVSPTEENDARLFGVEAERICRFPSAINVEPFTDLPQRGQFLSRLGIRDKKIVLFLGRLNWIKGVDVLIESVAMLSDPAKVHLVIAGPDDGAEHSLRSLVRDKKLEDKVTFTGFLDDTQKIRALADSDLVVIPSRSEGFPLALLEGLACGKPVIVSSACDLTGWMPGGPTWSSFRAGDARDLAEKLERALQVDADQNSLLRMRNFILSEFSVDALAVKAEALYNSVISQR